MPRVRPIRQFRRLLQADANLGDCHHRVDDPRVFDAVFGDRVEDASAIVMLSCGESSILAKVAEYQINQSLGSTWVPAVGASKRSVGERLALDFG